MMYFKATNFSDESIPSELELAIPVPTFGPITLHSLGPDIDLAFLDQRYAKLFNFWVNGGDYTRESAIGRTATRDLFTCYHDPLRASILLDRLDKFIEKLGSPDPHAKEMQRTIYESLRFAFLCGSRNVGNWILKEFNIDLKMTNFVEFDDVMARLGSSGNIDWLKEILIGIEADNIPDPVFTHVINTDDLYELAKDMGFDTSLFYQSESKGLK